MSNDSESRLDEEPDDTAAASGRRARADAAYGDSLNSRCHRSLRPAAAAFDPVLPEDDDMKSGDWFTTFAVGSANRHSQESLDPSVQVLDDEPILVIEEDAIRPVGRPQVRRQEYRNLFSRLRSG